MFLGLADAQKRHGKEKEDKKNEVLRQEKNGREERRKRRHDQAIFSKRRDHSQRPMPKLIFPWSPRFSGTCCFKGQILQSPTYQGSGNDKMSLPDPWYVEV